MVNRNVYFKQGLMYYIRVCIIRGVFIDNKELKNTLGRGKMLKVKVSFSEVLGLLNGICCGPTYFK